MIEEDFYASIKFKSGEEVFAKVLSTDEGGEKLLVVTNPVIIKEIRTRQGYGYKIEPWLKTTDDDMFIVNLNDVLTISESTNNEIIKMHTSFIRRYDNIKRFNNTTGITREMGYLSSVSRFKKLLENIYNNS